MHGSEAFSLPLVACLLLAVVGAFNMFITSLLSPLLFDASLALPIVLFKMYSLFAVTFLSMMLFCLVEPAASLLRELVGLSLI